MLNEAKITNHGGKVLKPDENFAREEDKEMELVRQSTTQKKQEQGIMFQRNQNKFVDQPKPLSEQEEQAIERERKAQKQQQKKNLKLPNNQRYVQNPQRFDCNKNMNDNNSGKGSQGVGRNSPEFDDFFDQTDEVNDQNRANIQPIAKKNDS